MVNIGVLDAWHDLFPKLESENKVSGEDSIPCVKRLFEWRIHNSANLAKFCCGLRTTWCHCVCFLCYLGENGGTINVCKFEFLTSRLVRHIRLSSVECDVNSPKFTHRFAQGSHESETVNFE